MIVRTSFNHFQRSLSRRRPILSQGGSSTTLSRRLLLNSTRGAFGAEQEQPLFVFQQHAFKSSISYDNNAEEKKKTTKRRRSKPYLLDLGIPSLVPEWKKMTNTETLFTDITAGLTVGCIAVPLSLAIALASGVPAEVGLATAAVSGVAGGLFGGTTLAVTGPAAAISLLVVGAVQEHGLEALPFITLGVGGLQLASGVTRMGVYAKLMPVSIIAGFTTGVGTLILSGQIPKALGMSAPAGMNPFEIAMWVGSNVSDINPAAAALAFGTAGAMHALPKVHPKIPSALLAVGGATAATHMFGLDVNLIGNLPSGMEAFQFSIPSLPSSNSIPSLAASTLLIYSMTSVESLLSCVALEKMKKTDYKHNPDQELVGQGIANIGAGFFMGMPVTSVIARSSLNARVGAQSRLPALVQSGFVFGSIAFMSSSISMIPMPALSGMLIATGANMLYPPEFNYCYSVDKATSLPYFTTVAGMLSMGLAEGIGIGFTTAMGIAIHKNMVLQLSMKSNENTGIEAVENKPIESNNNYISSSMDTLEVNSSDTVWKLRGPINFMSMFEIDDMIEDIKEKNCNNVILDMRNVTAMDFTGVEELVARAIEVADGAPIQIITPREDIARIMSKCDKQKRITYFSSIELVK